MFLSEVMVLVGRTHSKVEGVIPSVEEPTQPRGGKISENAECEK